VRVSRPRIAATAGVLVALIVATAPVAVANGRPLKAELTGAAELPGPGDPDGSGIARLRLNQGRGRICYTIKVQDITLPATGAHIHVGDATTFGPVVVGLEPPDATGESKGCVSADRGLIKTIRKNRSDYYVNVHTSDFLAGAIRGQLEKWAPGRPS
jgi:hypothetical protein